jgi:hypothetical protein
MIEFGVESLPSVATGAAEALRITEPGICTSAESGPVAHFPEVLLGKNACEILSLRSTS